MVDFDHNMLNSITAVNTCLGKYATFSGRSQRSEYWWLTLTYLILAGLFTMMGAYYVNESQISLLLSGLRMGVGFGLLVPMLAVTVRRLHDTNRSGWWILVALIPYAGGLVLTVLMCLPGTTGPNRFGDDPLGHVAPEVFE
jgi:uncharacterized membrane protein YhaH (DUF805 family)